MSAFLASAASRETDRNVMEAILKVAGGDEQKADLIWSAPWESQLAQVRQIVGEGAHHWDGRIGW